MLFATALGNACEASDSRVQSGDAGGNLEDGTLGGASSGGANAGAATEEIEIALGGAENAGGAGEAVVAGAGGAPVTLEAGSSGASVALEGEAGQAGAPAALPSCDPLEIEFVADGVRSAYLTSVLKDCRVEALARPSPPGTLFEFSVQVRRWTAWLLGCSEYEKEVAFGLVYQAEALSQADADLLIELYIRALSAEVALSEEQVSSLKERLEEAASYVIVNPSKESYSLSVPPCPRPPTSGEGGASGIGEGSGGSA